MRVKKGFNGHPYVENLKKKKEKRKKKKEKGLFSVIYLCEERVKKGEMLSGRKRVG